jgi:hypothetical protein
VVSPATSTVPDLSAVGSKYHLSIVSETILKPPEPTTKP